MPVIITPITNPAQLGEAHRIRRIVFVEEQRCPPELEYEFEEESHHFLALADGQPAGTARWRKTGSGYKLERFAVLKEMRGKGVGAALLQAVISSLPPSAEPVYLHAQISARDFYLKYHFKTEGAHFWEAGIEHVKMQLADPE